MRYPHLTSVLVRRVLGHRAERDTPKPAYAQVHVITFSLGLVRLIQW